MAVYVVTWDLNRERLNYSAARQAFVTHLEKLENTKDDGLDSVRFIATTSSPSQVREYLRLKLDKNDKLFITEVITDRNDGWLDKTVWAWINARTRMA